MSYPAVTSVPARALPPPSSVQVLDAQPILATNPRDAALWRFRDRSPGLEVVEWRAVWDVERAGVAAHRAHYRAWRHRPFATVLEDGADPVLVRYVGPLSIEWRSPTWARVTAQIAAAFPSTV